MDQLFHHFFNFALLDGYWGEIFQGLLVTVAMSVTCIAIGIPVGLGLAAIRLYGIGPLNFVIVVLVDILRSIPPLMLIVLVYFALPYLGVRVSSFWTTVLCVAVVLAAFAEEIAWAAITTVPAGQWEAGRSTGLTLTRTAFHIVYPQALRLSIPPLTNRAIAAAKSTTLGSVVAVTDLLSVANSLQSKLANPTALTVGAALFVIMFIPFVIATRWLEKKYGAKAAG